MANSLLALRMGCLIVIGCLFLSAVIGAFAWTYTLNSWLVYAGKPPSIVWWQGALLGMAPFIGQTSIPVAIVTWMLLAILA